MNHIGWRTFQALNGHSDTLRVLGLFSLEHAAFERLNELQDCHRLEIFRLEGAVNTKQYRWAEAGKPVFQDVVRWLQKCTALWNIELTAVPSGHTLCAQILEGPDIRPTAVALRSFDLGPDFSASLTGQTNLRQLTLEIRDEDVLETDDGRHALLANAISTCRKLRELDTNEFFTLEEVDQICGSLPQLEEIVLNGECITDAYLGSLSKLRRLKSLNIFGPSAINAGPLLEMLSGFAADPGGAHEGLQVWISNQAHNIRMTKEEKDAVTSILWSRFKGRFDISYRPERRTYHFESDSSD